MLTTHEQLRYSRQILVKKIGEQGQIKLRNAKVLIVGMGGLGNPVAMYLAAAGIGKLFIADGDNVDLTNLQRQIIFNVEDIDNNKVDVASEKLLQSNPEIDIEAIDEMLDQELCNYYIPEVDIVIDCTDNIAARYLVNKACVDHKKPFIIGAATGFDGQHCVIDPRQKNFPCYQCIFPKSDKLPPDNCQTHGIVGPVLPIIAGMQALQAIKILTDLPVRHDQLMAFDGFTNRWSSFSMGKQASCPVCNNIE